MDQDVVSSNCPNCYNYRLELEKKEYQYHVVTELQAKLIRAQEALIVAQEQLNRALQQRAYETNNVGYLSGVYTLPGSNGAVANGAVASVKQARNYQKDNLEAVCHNSGIFMTLPNPDITQSMIKTALEQEFGKVVKVQIVRKKKCVFVEFSSTLVRDRAVEQRQVNVDGHNCVIKAIFGQEGCLCGGETCKHA